MKKLLSIAAVAALVLSFGSCKPKEEITPEIKIDKSLTMYVGQEQKLVPQFVDCDSVDADLYWESNDEDVVKVDQNGKVTALKKGDAKVTVTYDKYQISAFCRIEVKEDELVITPEKASLKIGEQVQIKYGMLSGKAVKKADKIEVSDSLVAVLDSNLLLTATFPGEITISVVYDAKTTLKSVITVEDLDLPAVAEFTGKAADLVGKWMVDSTYIDYELVLAYDSCHLKGLEQGENRWSKPSSMLFAYGIEFFADGTAKLLMEDKSYYGSDKYSWKLEDGMLKTDASFSQEVMGLSFVFVLGMLAPGPAELAVGYMPYSQFDKTAMAAYAVEMPAADRMILHTKLIGGQRHYGGTERDSYMGLYVICQDCLHKEN